MDHDHHGGSSGGSDIFGGPILPDNGYMQRMYWAVIGSAIGLGTFINILNRLICRQRLSASANGHRCPAQPLSLFTRSWATLTAITREISYETPAVRWAGKRRWSSSLALGPILLVLANVFVLLGFCFYKFNLKDPWQWEDVGYRTGCITLAQLPLIFLLAGKKNLVGYLTGSSYERLNWLHRWAARCLFLTATIHMGYWFTSWNRWKYIGEKVATDPITRKGLGAWGVLFWIVLSSLSPIRGLSYEVFVVQHLISFAGFLAAVYLHIPAAMRLWIWIPVGLFAFDRLCRWLNTVYLNLSIFRRDKKGLQGLESFWACKADFVPVSEKYTRITIPKPPTSWKPGQHVFLACHSMLPGQSHPFTISSLPSDNKMEFLVRAEKGATKYFLNHAEKCQYLPSTESDTEKPTSTRTVAIEGPYGSMRPLHQFDTVTLIAGSTGATFTVPLLRDLVRRWAPVNKGSPPARSQAIITRRIRFVWIVRNTHQLEWFSEQIEEALIEGKRIVSNQPCWDINIDLFVTCDEKMTGGIDTTSSKSTDQAGPRLSTSLAVDSSSSSARKEPKVSESENLNSSSSSSTSDPQPQSHSYGSNGTCCCRTTISSSSNPQPRCNCHGPSSPSNSTTKRLPTSTGRPSLRDIILPELEMAIGESAVVVCGPPALVRDVRTMAARLSDERAVHKGSGAQGVWVWGEGFSY
ncbi:MAG: hypothetical protein M1814_000345 [Vezdaea aestivalis]|nr:MAG: hypothetical protein M1814_000345 [Vezdaea aestivalis]